MRVNRIASAARRRGYGLLEMAMAVFVLMVAMTLTVKVVGWSGRERRAADRKVYALQEVSNVLERATAGPFDRIDAESLRELTTKSPAAAVLPGAEWEAEVSDADAPAPGSRRVTLRLRWTGPSGDRDASVRLSAWVFARRRPS